jgi:hypothetical protein
VGDLMIGKIQSLFSEESGLFRFLVSKMFDKSEGITTCDQLKNLKYAKALPNAFTEHGAIMAASEEISCKLYPKEVQSYPQ